MPLRMIVVWKVLKWQKSINTDTEWVDIPDLRDPFT